MSTTPDNQSPDPAPEHSPAPSAPPSPRRSPPAISATSLTSFTVLEVQPTNYSRFVTSAFLNSRRRRGEQARVDQDLLRRCLSLSSSYLIADTCMDPEHGVNTWFNGFNALIETIIALHKKEELDIETMNAASKACSECWSVSGAWRGLEGCRDGVRKVARKLKTLLDENGRTYQGQRVYAP
ncbi:hypothetical protein D9757_004892 [Collybiopsis confluens]|uniref:Uncharacterized protein n=1 Tax=Collybiopsis confluens TaxID=2823264 RepID=A0A8H5HTN5_9AGAR|nr:hypothetical protein D9757_004892 [Collybiopsis confluens]